MTGNTIEETGNRLAQAIADLESLRAEVGAIERKELSQGVFAQRFLPFSAGTYSKLQDPKKYGARLDGMTLKCEAAADTIRARLEALRKRAEAEKGFIKTRFALAALGAWQRAQDDEGTRVIVLLGPTGSGKSAIGRHLAAKHAATYAEGRQSWRSSNKAFCRDVAAAAKSPITARTCDEHYAEQAMLDALGPRAGTLYIDEANTLGPFVANTVKLIANQTLHTVFIAAIPEMWTDFCKRSENEVRQVLNRCQAVIRFPGVTDAEARQFMAGCGLADADMVEACRMACRAANEAGAYKLIQRTAALLREQEHPALIDAEKAVALARAALDEGRSNGKC
jgi:hypothetical protein